MVGGVDLYREGWEQRVQWEVWAAAAVLYGGSNRLRHCIPLPSVRPAALDKARTAMRCKSAYLN